MQPTPLRLSQTLRIAFVRARPTRSYPIPARKFTPKQAFLYKTQICSHNPLGFPREVSFYSTESPSSPSTKDGKSSPSPSNTDFPSNASARHAESSSSSPSSSLPLSLRLGHTLDHLQTLLLTSSRRLNDLTGYTSIEALKSEISSLESAVSAARSSLAAARTAYTTAVTTRSTSQREVNSLLQRKHAWSAADLERFTQLYRSDHANEVEETRAQEELAAREREVEELQARLGMGILKRYHEEQVWSDKIRRMSTWGTWGLMAVNVLLFLVLQVVVEPWRRRRLVRGFKEEVRGLVEEKGKDVGAEGAVQQQQQQPSLLAKGTASDGEDMQDASDSSEAVLLGTETPTPDPTMGTVEALQQDLTPLTDISTSSPNPIDPLTPSSPSATTAQQQQQQQQQPPPAGLINRIRHSFDRASLSLSSLFSDRPLTLTQRDVTARTMEGFAAGAALVGVLVVVLRPR